MPDGSKNVKAIDDVIEIARAEEQRAFDDFIDAFKEAEENFKIYREKKTKLSELIHQKMKNGWFEMKKKGKKS